MGFADGTSAARLLAPDLMTLSGALSATTVGCCVLRCYLLSVLVLLLALYPTDSLIQHQEHRYYRSFCGPYRTDTHGSQRRTVGVSSALYPVEAESLLVFSQAHCGSKADRSGNFGEFS